MLDRVPDRFRTENVGIGTDADSILGLSIRSASCLFDGEGGHQLKLNRPDDAHTASLIFSTDHSTHAEIGLTGGMGLTIKTTPDGLVFSNALSVDPVTAIVDCPAGLTRDGHAVYDSGNAPGILFDRCAIANGQDLDMLIQRGTYFQTSNYRASTGSHYPRSLAGTLTVIEAPFETLQRYQLYGGAQNGEGGAIFLQSLYGGVWKAWRKLVTEPA